MDTIVIGEGVELDARPASAVSRLLGALIDLVVLAVVLIVIGVVLASVMRSAVSEAVANVGGTLAIAAVLIVLPTTVDTLTRGRTLGKLAVGIRIVRDDGGPIVFRQAFVRALVGVVELWLTFGSIALICSPPRARLALAAAPARPHAGPDCVRVGLRSLSERFPTQSIPQRCAGRQLRHHSLVGARCGLGCG